MDQIHQRIYENTDLLRKATTECFLSPTFFVSIHEKCGTPPQKPTANQDSYWELGSQDTPLFARLVSALHTWGTRTIKKFPNIKSDEIGQQLYSVILHLYFSAKLALNNNLSRNLLLTDLF